MSTVRELRAQRARGWAERMQRQVARAKQLPSPPVEGSLTRMVGLALEASGCQAAVGDVCALMTGDGSRVEAEVVANEFGAALFNTLKYLGRLAHVAEEGRLQFIHLALHTTRQGVERIREMRQALASNLAQNTANRLVFRLKDRSE